LIAIIINKEGKQLKKCEVKKIGKDDLLTVREFSEIVDIPVSKLHFYDKKGIFTPVDHGEGGKSKYRYYSPMQITTIKMIRVLNEIGVPLEIIASLDKHRNPETMIKLLSKNKRIISYEIDYLKVVLDIINTYHDNIMEGINADEEEISICEMPKVQITLGEKTDFGADDSFYNNYMDFCAKPRNPKLNLSYPVGGYFDSMEDFSNHPSQPSRFYSLDPSGRNVKDKGLYLIGYTRGYYGETNDLPDRLMDYAEKHKIEFVGPVYNMYLFDEISMSDTSKYLLQVSASIKDARHEFNRHPHRHFKSIKE
jgi:DNA-binding transcriptional MerR regulator